MSQRSSAAITAVGCGIVAVLGLGTAVGATVPDDSTATSTATDTDTATDTSTLGFPDDVVLPPGYTTLIDTTGLLTVAVPDTWSDIDLEPDIADGAVIPRINAATDLDVWRETFDAPGVLYAAYPYTADAEALSRDFAPSGCADEEVMPYDDGAFFGEWWRFTECGVSRQAEFHVIVASPASEDVSVVVVVQLVGPEDQSLLDAVLQSFNFTPTATWPATTTSVLATSTSVSATIPAEPVSSTPVETTYLENNTGLLSVEIPSEWDDMDTIGGLNDDGSYRPTIAAAPNLSDFFAGRFDAPGARVVALPPDTDPTGVMANAQLPTDCASGGATPFDNGQYTGLSQAFAGCAGGTMDVVIVAASPQDGSFVLYAQVQEESGGGLIPVIIDSLGAPDPSAYPPTTAPPTSATSGAVPETLLQGPVQPEALTVIDSTRQLRISVPSSWQDLRLTPSFNNDASARPRIVASLHIQTMSAQREVPGVVFLELPYVDPATYLANRNLGTNDCLDGILQSFDNGSYRGLLHTWTGCGGTEARLITIVVSPPNNSATLALDVQLPTDDDTALRTLLASFGQL
jgi:hypothetical protein